MKKFITMMCSLILSVVLFAGCNLTEINKAKYYNQVVITVTENEDYNREYTKKDLIEAFYNYSYSSVQNGTLGAEEGINQAITSMIEKGLLLDGIKKNYFETNIIDFSDEDCKAVRDEAFKYMQDQIFELEEEVREEWEIQEHVHQDESEEEVADSLRAEYTLYEPKIVLESVTIDAGTPTERVVTRAVRNEDYQEDIIIDYTVPEHFVQQITDEKVSAEAYTRYIKALQQTAKSEGRDTDTQKVLRAEEDRLIKLLTENKYLNLFQEWLNDNNIYDKDANGTYVLKDSVANTVVDYYKEQYMQQYNLYSQNESAYHSAMASDVSKVYYHPNAGNEYMYVSHILLKFNDAQISQITALKAQLEKGQITQAQYDVKAQAVANKTIVTYERNNNTYTANATTVYNNVVNYVNQSNDVTKRAKLFNDMIYIYNDDEGIMNKDFAYVVNLDTSVKDQMVAEFANASRELNNNAEKGVGSLSEMVISEYGIHIIFHAGLVNNVIEYNSLDSLTYEMLFQRTTQLSSQKTLFNYVYDTLTFDTYNTRASQIVDQAKGSGIQITKYASRYKDLYK